MVSSWKRYQSARQLVVTTSAPDSTDPSLFQPHSHTGDSLLIIAVINTFFDVFVGQTEVYFAADAYYLDSRTHRGSCGRGYRCGPKGRGLGVD